MLGTLVISVNNRISAFCDHYSVNQSLSVLEWSVVCPGISGWIICNNTIKTSWALLCRTWIAIMKLQSFFTRSLTPFVCKHLLHKKHSRQSLSDRLLCWHEQILKSVPHISADPPWKNTGIKPGIFKHLVCCFHNQLWRITFVITHTSMICSFSACIE